MKQRKGYGIGKGQGYKNMMPMDSHIHSLSAKGVKQKVDYMRAVVRFEDLNPDYPSTQMQGIKIEVLERDYKDPNYIDEKIENTKRFYNNLLDNFGNRIKDPEIQKEFKKRLESGSLKAKGTKYPRDRRNYEIKGIFKKKYPNAKIKVRIQKYSGGESINVYTDLLKDPYNTLPEFNHIQWKRRVGQNLSQEEYKIYKKGSEMWDKMKEKEREIKILLSDFSYVSRDQFGEVLSGGNTFLFVEPLEKGDY